MDQIEMHGRLLLSSRRKILLCILLLLCTVTYAAGLNICPDITMATGPVKNSTDTAEEKKLRLSVGETIGKDAAKACLNMMQKRAEETNHFYVLDINDTIVVGSEICSQNETEMEDIVSILEWQVAKRTENKHNPLFGYPIDRSNKPKWLENNPTLHASLKHVRVDTLPNKNDYCITKTGMLRVKRFVPEMAGTYTVRIALRMATMNPRVLELTQFMKSIFYHLDYVYDNDDGEEARLVRNIPILAPKVTKARMFDKEPNLRYQYRTSTAVLRSKKMESEGSRDPKAATPNIYPEKLFNNMSIHMMWRPPPELHQFTDWKPSCGTKITRDRYLHCSVEVDVARLEITLNRFTHSGTLEKQYDFHTPGEMFKNGQGLAIMNLLYVLVTRLQVQLLDEARETPNRRKLYSAGLRWVEMGADKIGSALPTKLSIPCHYSLLNHLPRTTVMSERMATTFIPSINNIGEREQAVRLCGLADPLELLRMMGQLLVAHLRRLVSMTRRRPIVPQRSIVSSGKMVYMKCPVDLHLYEQPVCNIPGREDTILWTLNGKSMRFFGENVERGPFLTADCALTIKNIGFNDAGIYVCYRTTIGGKTVEEEPAYRHYIDIVRPDFDPPPIEEVYFGLAVCLAWIAFLLLLWTFIAIARGVLSLLCKDPESHSQNDMWTSFYDNDPALVDVDEDEEYEEDDDDDDDEDDEEEDEEDDDEEYDEKGTQAVVFGDDADGEAMDEAKSKVKDEAKSEVKDEAKSEVKDEAKSEVKDEAKSEVKDEAKSEVKDEAKEEVKDEAKDEVKDEVKDEAKGEDVVKGEGEAKDEAKVEGEGEPKGEEDKGEANDQPKGEGEAAKSEAETQGEGEAKVEPEADGKGQAEGSDNDKQADNAKPGETESDKAKQD